jgi:hypothetical protein
VIAWLAGALVAVLFAVVATSGGVEFADRAPSFDSESRVVPPPPTTVPPTTVPAGTPEGSPWQLPAFVEVIVRVVFLTVVAIFAVLVLLYAWQHRPTWRWTRGRRRHAADFVPLDDVAAAVTADADAQRAALAHGSPRNAIVECWLRLERSVIEAGVRRDPSDTSAELTERVLANGHVDPTAISRLAELYREARFSNHSMGEDSRHAAIAALDAVHAGLRSDPGSSATSTGTATATSIATGP